MFWGKNDFVEVIWSTNREGHQPFYHSTSSSLIPSFKYVRFHTELSLITPDSRQENIGEIAFIFYRMLKKEKQIHVHVLKRAFSNRYVQFLGKTIP